MVESMNTDSVQTRRVLVTGGSGFIGSALCQALIAQGYEVWVATRNRTRAVQRLHQSVHVVENLTELAGKTFFALINLAGESLGDARWTEQKKQEFRRSRVDYTRQLFQFFAEQKSFPHVLINASAIGIYGDRGAEPVDESATPGDDFAARLCRDWELAALNFKHHCARVCLLRIGIVLDRQGGALKKMLPAFKAGLGGRMGDGNHHMSWITRNDLIRLITFLLNHELTQGVFNAVAPEPVTNREFTAQLAKSLYRPSLLPMPAPLLRLLFGEMADALLLSGQRVLPERALAAGFVFTSPDLPAAFKEIFKK